MDRFDLHIDAAAEEDVSEATLPFDPACLKTTGRIYLALPLAEARAAKKAAKRYDARAYIVPVSYRVPQVSIEEARTIALKQHAEVKKRRPALEDLDDGSDGPMWWTFSAVDVDAVNAGWIPGRIFISIDKLDGHLVTDAEHYTFADWQSV
jgi:hypothetical protein